MKRKVWGHIISPFDEEIRGENKQVTGFLLLLLFALGCLLFRRIVKHIAALSGKENRIVRSSCETFCTVDRNGCRPISLDFSNGLPRDGGDAVLNRSDRFRFLMNELRDEPSDEIEHKRI